MSNSDLEEIKRLSQALAKHEIVGQEYRRAIEAVANSGDPAALPVLRRTLNAAKEYERWAESRSKGTSDAFRNNAPGGWMVELLPAIAKEYVSSLQLAVETCTPKMDSPVNESKKKGWKFWK